MRVIVVEQTGFGRYGTTVHRYTKEKYRQLVENEFEWAKENDHVDNESEVETWLADYDDNDGILDDVSIIESDYVMHYTVCVVLD